MTKKVNVGSIGHINGEKDLTQPSYISTVDELIEEEAQLRARIARMSSIKDAVDADTPPTLDLDLTLAHYTALVAYHRVLVIRIGVARMEQEKH